MDLGPAAWSALRLALSRMLREGAPEQAQLQDCLMLQAQAEYAVPAQHWRLHTDFYTSIHPPPTSASCCARTTRCCPTTSGCPSATTDAAAALVSGQGVRRPVGQVMRPGASAPVLAPAHAWTMNWKSASLWVAATRWASRLRLDAAGTCFGLCLFNDWSARDLQGWEYQPLGPSCPRTLPVPCPLGGYPGSPGPPAKPSAPADHPAPRPTWTHAHAAPMAPWRLSWKSSCTPPRKLTKAWPSSASHSNFRDAYWTISQMVAHHTVGGCNLHSGDLLGSGTQTDPRLAKPDR